LIKVPGKLFSLLFTAEHAGFFLRDLCALRGDKKYFAGTIEIEKKKNKVPGTSSAYFFQDV